MTKPKQLVDMTGNEIRVFQHLRCGKKNRRTRNYLMITTGMSDRAIRAAVHSMRAKGVPVCSITAYPGGYWLCNDADELKHFIAELEIQRNCFGMAIHKLRKMLKEVEDGKMLF